MSKCKKFYGQRFKRNNLLVFLCPLHWDGTAARCLSNYSNALTMEQLNRIELRGLVGSVRVQTYEGSQVARINLATNVAYKDKDGAAVIETTWHNVSAWEGKGIQDLDQIRKGSKLYVVGRLRVQKYTGADGMDKVITDVLANRVVLIPDEEQLQYEM